MDTNVKPTPLHTEVRTSADILRVMEMIPHRQPFLMIDRVEDIRARESAVGIKNVTINEEYFRGHFPSRPVMPGVLIIEAMAQTAAVLVVATLGEGARGKLVYLIERTSTRLNSSHYCASRMPSSD